ncbi:MAG: hypothetical protein ACE366_10300 [Bradymonadia bacterium]
MATAVSACADATDTESVSPEPEASAQEGRSTGTCPTGKCDGFLSRVKDYYSDMRSLDLNDLVSLGTGLATDQFNDLLGGTDYVNLKLEDTGFYGEGERELFGETVQQDINDLQAGLTANLGEHAFATRVNALRRDTLANTDYTVFAESAFKLEGRYAPSWSIEQGDVLGTLGFDISPKVTAIVIAPHDDNLDAVWQNPLKVLQQARGYVIPRSIEDIKSMVPGESFALQAEGVLGFNLGVGMPIMIGTIADFVTLSARLSAGARVSLSGDLDVQLIRGEGSEAWIDVGLSKQRLRHFSLALRSGWGVEGFSDWDLDIDLGPVNVDLEDIVTKALEKQLNKRLAVFSATASSGSESTRMTVARFRVDLDGADEFVVQAVHQALKGDIRLAQALANRPRSGVVQELDLAKDARSESTYLGFRFLSMNFFRSKNYNTGTVTIDADGQRQTLLFSELERESGLFWNEKQSKWRQVTSLITEDGELVDAEINARLTLGETDDYLGRDDMLDHLDPLLGYFVGFSGLFDHVNPAANGLFDFTNTHCGGAPGAGDDAENSKGYDDDEWEACHARLPSTSQFQAFVTRAWEGFDYASSRWLVDGFDPAFTSSFDIARRLNEVKLAVSGQADANNWSANGPEGRFLTQVRFSDAALHDMLGQGDARTEEFAEAMSNVLAMMRLDRDDEYDPEDRVPDSFWRDLQKRMAEIVTVYDEHAKAFTRLDRLSELTYAGDTLGGHAQLLLIDPDRPRDAELATIAERKGAIVGTLFENMREEASRIGENREFVIGYSLMWMTKPENIELLVDFNIEKDHRWDYDDIRTRIYTRGSDSFIGAGQFNLDELLRQ